jgi:hypothetical protein
MDKVKLLAQTECISVSVIGRVLSWFTPGAPSRFIMLVAEPKNRALNVRGGGGPPNRATLPLC